MEQTRHKPWSSHTRVHVCNCCADSPEPWLLTVGEIFAPRAMERILDHDRDITRPSRVSAQVLNPRAFCPLLSASVSPSLGLLKGEDRGDLGKQLQAEPISPQGPGMPGMLALMGALLCQVYLQQPRPRPVLMGQLLPHLLLPLVLP